MSIPIWANRWKKGIFGICAHVDYVMCRNIKLTGDIAVWFLPSTKLDQIQLMANDSCKMAWINLIYLRKNWQSEGQRINKSWQWLLEFEFFLILFLTLLFAFDVPFASIWRMIFLETIPLVLIWLLWRQFVDRDDISFSWYWRLM